MQSNSVIVRFVPMVEGCSVKVDNIESSVSDGSAGVNNRNPSSYWIKMNSGNPNPEILEYHVRCITGS